MLSSLVVLEHVFDDADESFVEDVLKVVPACLALVHCVIVICLLRYYSTQSYCFCSSIWPVRGESFVRNLLTHFDQSGVFYTSECLGYAGLVLCFMSLAVTAFRSLHLVHMQVQRQRQLWTVQLLLELEEFVLLFPALEEQLILVLFEVEELLESL